MKTYWMVKVNQGLNGWKVLDTFKTPADADKAIEEICRTQGVPCTDFIVKPITMV